jgi:hypothetical protein
MQARLLHALPGGDLEARNLLAWLDARAEYFATRYGYGQSVAYDSDGMSDITAMAIEHDLEAEWERQIEDPHGWLRDTPFYRRLAELAGADDVDVALPRTVTRPQPRGAPKVES